MKKVRKSTSKNPLTDSEVEFRKRLEELCSKIPSNHRDNLQQFFNAYKGAVVSFEENLPTLCLYLQMLEEEFKSPSSFEPYHTKIRHPTDYYRFGLDFVKPLVELEKSNVLGKDNLAFIAESLKNKENVVLLANHQTEGDPQAIAILLEQTHPEIAESLICVAGERVVTDPLAIPFSKGCDLLCIYSKRYIDYPPEKKEDKQMHNKKTMQLMSRLLQEGGKIIYVAPSGGRDRKNAQGEIQVAPFDPDSIEMFYLMAKKAKRKTHFIPFTLATYDLMPPPETIQKEIGEARTATRTPIHIAFAPPFDMEANPNTDKKEKRKQRADAIWNIVCRTYKTLVDSEE